MVLFFFLPNVGWIHLERGGIQGKGKGNGGFHRRKLRRFVCHFAVWFSLRALHPEENKHLGGYLYSFHFGPMLPIEVFFDLGCAANRELFVVVFFYLFTLKREKRKNIHSWLCAETDKLRIQKDVHHVMQLLF